MVRRLLIIFTITFTVTFLTQIAYDLPTVKQYIKDQIYQAKLINVIVKYNVKPEGLET